MLKLLRNLVLAAILLAGALKLLAWYAVGNDADRVKAALAPYAQVKYDGLSAGLDGSVTVDNVTAVQTGSHATYHADVLTIETPGLFWLLNHSLLHETDVPQTLGLSASGLKTPTPSWLDPQFLDPVHAVVFAAAGCGAVTFSADDYRRMNSPAASVNLRADYHYQPDSHALDLKTTLSVPGYSAITLRTDLHPFDLTALANPQTWDKVRAGQIAVDFADDGFMHRRNQYCAQRVGAPPNQFIAQHVTAVETLLGEHRVQPSSEVVALYRNLVEHGGQASVLSLPRNTLAFTRWQSSSPDDLLRQLNITARYRDTPPVMFRLMFTPLPDDEAPAIGAVSTPATAIAAPATVEPSIVTKAPPPPVNAETKPNPAAILASTTPAPDIAKAPPPAKRPGDSFGLHDLDRVEAKLAPKQAPIKTPPPPEPVQPAQSIVTDAQYASSPPPPPNSTLALVWKPTIERLPPPVAPKTDYDIVDYATLQNMLGRHVRLITDGAKRIEGYVMSADAGSVRLRVGRSDGDAQFDVPRKRIREVQLLRRGPPA
jgi:hypothetical protein